MECLKKLDGSQRREPNAPYCKIISKSGCCWLFCIFFCSLQVGSGHCRLSLTHCGLYQVVSYLLQVISRSFLVPYIQVFSSSFRSFQVISCLLQVVSVHFLPVIDCFRSFLACCKSFQVVSSLLQVISGRFLLVVGHRSFQVISCLLQVIVARLFQVVLILVSSYLSYVLWNFPLQVFSPHLS